MKDIVLNIEGMKCEGCVNRIKNVLSMVKGVQSYDVSLEDKRLLVSVKNEKVLGEVTRKIEALGFKVFK